MGEMDTTRCPVCPELLEVLEAIVEDVRDDESFSSIEDQALLYRAEATIAKATGQEGE